MKYKPRIKKTTQTGWQLAYDTGNACGHQQDDAGNSCIVTIHIYPTFTENKQDGFRIYVEEDYSDNFSYYYQDIEFLDEPKEILALNKKTFITKDEALLALNNSQDEFIFVD